MGGRKHNSTSETTDQKQLPSIMKVRFHSIIFVLEIARFLGVFGINTASDISKFTKISRAAAAASNIWEF